MVASGVIIRVQVINAIEFIIKDADWSLTSDRVKIIIIMVKLASGVICYLGVP